MPETIWLKLPTQYGAVLHLTLSHKTGKIRQQCVATTAEQNHDGDDRRKRATPPTLKKVILPVWEVFGFGKKNKRFGVQVPRLHEVLSTASYFCKVMVTNSLSAYLHSFWVIHQPKSTRYIFDWLLYFYRYHNNSIIMIYFTLDNWVMKILYHHSFNLNSIAITNLSLK